MAITSFRAGEAISAGDVVFVSASGFLYRSIADQLDQAATIGVAIDGGAQGSLIRVNNDSLYLDATSLVPGQYQYVSLLSSGQYEDYTAWASGFALTSYDAAYLTIVGRATSTTSIEVEVSKPLQIVNPTSVFLLESHSGPLLDAILQEDGSTIDLETA